MALTKDVSFTIQGGFEVKAQGAYIRIDGLMFNNSTEFFTVGYYKAKEEKTPFKVEQYSCEIDKSGDNFIKQSYEYLKTLPEFSGSVNC